MVPACCQLLDCSWKRATERADPWAALALSINTTPCVSAAHQPPTTGSGVLGNDGRERCPHAGVAGLLVLWEGRSPAEHPARLTAPWAAQQGAGLTTISLLRHQAGSQRAAPRGKNYQ